MTQEMRVPRVQSYLEARRWAMRENLNDVVDAAKAGFWEEVVHAVGAESPSVLAQRMQVRRAYCRQVARGLPVSQPSLPKIQPGQLRVS